MKVLAQKGTVKNPWGSKTSRIALIFEPRDCWVGFYWNVNRGMWWFELYVIIVPMLPVKFTWRLPSHPEAKE